MAEKNRAAATAAPAGGQVDQILSLCPWPLIAIMSAAFVVILPFFFFGIPSGHDFEFHMYSWMEVLRQWKHGMIYPRWADLAHYGYGEPRFVFYPPASWILGAALGAVLPWTLAPGAYVWIALTLSGCSMFVLARQWLGRRDAMLAAALYAANPYYIVIVYWRSAFAELLAGALLPLLLLCVLRLEQDARKWILRLSLVVAAAWLINLPSAVMVNYSLALFMVMIAASKRSPKFLWYGGIAALLGAALAAFYLVPATYEQRWVAISQVLSAGVRPRDNFLFTLTNDPDHRHFNLLISTIALAEIAALALVAPSWRRWRRLLPRAGSMLVCWGALASLLMFSFTALAWDHLPKMRFMQLPWRWMLCLNAALALLLAVAWRRVSLRLLVFAAMLAVLGSAAHYFQPPWWDHFLDIAVMKEDLRTVAGYEGTDEYAPLSADPYEINQQARRVSFEGSGADQIQILEWEPESKSLTAVVSAPGKLVMRLFNYPAWRIEINGNTVTAETRAGTGQMMIPVPPGENHVRITFTRTRDRTVGGIISALTVVLFIGLSVSKQRKLAQT